MPRSPTTPDQDAGIRTEPPVSEPIDARHRDAANEAPEPELEIPGERSRSHGFRHDTGMLRRKWQSTLPTRTAAGLLQPLVNGGASLGNVVLMTAIAVSCPDAVGVDEVFQCVRDAVERPPVVAPGYLRPRLDAPSLWRNRP